MPVPTPSPSLGLTSVPTPSSSVSQPATTLPETTLRAALGDDAVWDELIADPTTKSQVENWIKATCQSIDAQLTIRREEFEAWNIADLNSDFHETENQYRIWRKKAVSMKALCQKRLTQLKLRWVETNRRLDAYAQLVSELGRVISEHKLAFDKAERTPAVMDAWLWDVLDRLILPGDNGFTVGELVTKHD